MRRRRGFAAPHYTAVFAWLVFRERDEEGTGTLMLEVSHWVDFVVLIVGLAGDDVVGV
jgi:hypothetical protein